MSSSFLKLHIKEFNHFYNFFISLNIIKMLQTNSHLNYQESMEALGIPQDVKVIRQQPESGDSAAISAGANTDFIIKGRRPGIIVNTADAYVYVGVNNGDASGCYFPGQIGISSLVRRVVVASDSNPEVSKIEVFNGLYAIKATENFSNEMLAGSYSTMFGTAANYISSALAAAGTVYYIFRVSDLVGFLKNKYLNMDCNEDLHIKIYWESSFLISMIGEDAGFVSTNITLAYPRLVYEQYRMTQEQYKALISSLPDKTYRLSTTDYYYQSMPIATDLNEFSLTLGMASYLGVKAIYFSLRTTSIANGAAQSNAFSRNQAKLSEYWITLNGSDLHQSHTLVSATNASESMYQLLMHNGGLKHPMSLGTTAANLNTSNWAVEEGAGTSNATTGTFFGFIDMQSGLEDSSLISGIPISNGSCILNLKKSANSTAAQTLEVWVEYHSRYECPLGGNWVVVK